MFLVQVKCLCLAVGSTDVTHRRPSKLKMLLLCFFFRGVYGNVELWMRAVHQHLLWLVFNGTQKALFATLEHLPQKCHAKRRRLWKWVIVGVHMAACVWSGAFFSWGWVSLAAAAGRQAAGD